MNPNSIGATLLGLLCFVSIGNAQSVYQPILFERTGLRDHPVVDLLDQRIFHQSKLFFGNLFGLNADANTRFPQNEPLIRDQYAYVPYSFTRTVSYGTKLVLPTTNDPGFQSFGGGITLGLEEEPWRMFLTKGYSVAPIFNLDIIGQGYDEDLIGETAGGLMINGSDFLSVSMLLGGRFSKPLRENHKFFYQLGVDVHYSFTNINNVLTPAADAQRISVNQITEDNWSVGYFAGAGFEFPFRCRPCRAYVNMEAYKNDIITNIGRLEAQLAFGFEFIVTRKMAYPNALGLH